MMRVDCFELVFRYLENVLNHLKPSIRFLCFFVMFIKSDFIVSFLIRALNQLTKTPKLFSVVILNHLIFQS